MAAGLLALLGASALNRVVGGKGGYGPDQAGVPDDFKCAWRNLSFEYSIALRPDAAADVYDALALGEYCNGTVRPDPAKLPKVFPPAGRHPSSATNQLYVDGTNGNDAHAGTLSKPLKTIAAAFQRAVPRAGGPISAVVVRGGTYHLGEPLHIGPELSGLNMSNFPGEEVWLSGTRPLANLKWTKSSKGAVMAPGVIVWQADVSHAMADGVPIAELRVNGARAWLARHPNANPELETFPVGYSPSKGKDWLPPKISPSHTPALQVNVSDVRDFDNYFPSYIGGINGSCAIYDPPFSFWCAAQFPAAGRHSGCGGCHTYQIPSGLSSSNLEAYRSLLNPPKGTNNTAFLQAWRINHWANWRFEIESYTSNVTPQSSNIEVSFGKGGFQGARGGVGSDFYVENVIETLDEIGEYYYDVDTKTLYLIANTTDGSPPPADTTVLAVLAKDLLIVKAPSRHAPVSDISLYGIGFRDTRMTMLEPHGVPSGGDWALERMAAVFLENTERVSINSCKFWKLGGNGLMLSKSNLHTTVAQNEFAWLGASAVLMWGWTDELTDNGIHGYDGTSDEFPRYTLVEENVFREIGIWEKQSSAVFLAKGAEATLSRNVVFNLGRAGFNFNDGFGGGDKVVENVLFNTCRESSDHGPINSWDRQPFLTTVRTGIPSTQMAWREVTRNVIISNYGGSKEVDTDDGSLYFRIHSNFMIYGWAQKFKCGGIESFDNVKAFATLGGKFDAGCILGEKVFAPNLWHDDIIVSGAASDFDYRMPWGSDAAGHDWDKTQCYNNTLYIPKPYKATVGKISLVEFQTGGNDPGTLEVAGVPPTVDIIKWAKDRLGKFTHVSPPVSPRLGL